MTPWWLSTYEAIYVQYSSQHSTMDSKCTQRVKHFEVFLLWAVITSLLPFATTKWHFFFTTCITITRWQKVHTLEESELNWVIVLKDVAPHIAPDAKSWDIGLSLDIFVVDMLKNIHDTGDQQIIIRKKKKHTDRVLDGSWGHTHYTWHFENTGVSWLSSTPFIPYADKS